MYIGQQVNIQASCPTCGKRMLSFGHPQSLFLIAHCDNLDCVALGVHLTIEKASGMVVATAPLVYIDHETGKRLLPVLADRDGKQVWPKP